MSRAMISNARQEQIATLRLLDHGNVDASSLQPMLFDDTPRTRQSDPDTSHAAGDKSQKTVVLVRDRVLAIIAEFPAGLAAFEMCEIYQRRALVGGWPKVLLQTPRKRMSDLLKEGYLIDTGVRRTNREHSSEAVLAVKP